MRFIDSYLGPLTHMALEGASWYFGNRYGREEEMRSDINLWREKVEHLRGDNDRLAEKNDSLTSENQKLRAALDEANTKIVQIFEAYQKMEKRAKRYRRIAGELSEAAESEGAPWWRRLWLR